MKKKLHTGRYAAILGCAASLAGTAMILGPTAASAEAGTSCANTNIKIQYQGEKAIHVPVKAITVEGGATCAEAGKLIADVLEGKLPSGWKSGMGNFQAPEGLIPSELKKGSKRIRYAIHGG